jgi:hypothetical protein
MNRDMVYSYFILANVYNDLECIISFTERIDAAKKITIKIILNECQCKTCIDAAYFIHQINFNI